VLDRVLPLPVMPPAPPGPVPRGARAFWVTWLRAQAEQRRAVTVSPAAAVELAQLLEEGPTRTG